MKRPLASFCAAFFAGMSLGIAWHPPLLPVWCLFGVFVLQERGFWGLAWRWLRLGDWGSR